MLLADVVKDYSKSVMTPLAYLEAETLRTKLDALTEFAAADLASEGFRFSEVTFEAALATRYCGQAFEIDVPYTREMNLASLASRFHELHQQRYGYSNPQRATEAVQLRLRAVGRTVKPQLLARQNARGVAAQPQAIRDIIFNGRPLSTAVFHRAELAPAEFGRGPALIVGGESTTVVLPGWRWRIDDAGTLNAEKESHP
jgi:N-methylhydantoinase A